MKVGGHELTCVWAHPLGDRRLVFTLRDLPAVDEFSKLELRLRTAFSDGVVNRSRASVTTRVVQAGREVGKLIRTNRRGWVNTEVPVEVKDPNPT